eukprot:scaffold125065_cov30-Tisochrysis_lutea.AAC.1
MEAHFRAPRSSAKSSSSTSMDGSSAHAVASSQSARGAAARVGGTRTHRDTGKRWTVVLRRGKRPLSPLPH